MERDVCHLAGPVTPTVDLVHEGFDPAPLAGAVGDVGALAGEDLLRTRRFHDAGRGLDPLAHVPLVVVAQPVAHPRRPIPRLDPPAVAVAQQHADQRHVG